MASTSPILALPLELLQQITSEFHGFYSSADLLALRLVCKQISAAVFDQFAAEYLHRRECFILDKDRVYNLIDQFNTPTIARRISKVRVSIEGLNYGPVSQIYQAKPNTIRLDRFVNALARNRCELELDLSCRTEYWYAHRLQWIHDTMDGVGRAKCKVRRLDLSEHIIPGLSARVTRGSGFMNFLLPLQTLCCDLILSVAGVVDHIEGLRSIEEIINCVPALEELELRTLFKSTSRMTYHASVDRIMVDILLATTSRKLSRLHISYGSLEPKIFAEVLQNFEGTLQDFRGNNVGLLSARDVWTEALRVISNLPKLRRLSLSNCRQVEGLQEWDVAMAEHDPTKVCPTWLKLECIGTHTVREQIKATLERGLVLRERF
ncbi:hypothetical protein LTR97_001288 [Elasticomyces elasticus]|uniref:F-box domain-containing protein n=1 Tax=Elasticomyces elasticus TaxID=574655 RepID=A0AAN8A503_9PEZI|nr:hypothetical protein LTR97_001288 [Elasticomyces elasticus]